jgi:hypothetical protein
MRFDLRTLVLRVGIVVVALITAVTVALALAGCGDRNLILNVDVLSYLSPSQSEAAFGPMPAVPGGIATGEQPLVDNMTINLVDNLGNVLEVRSVRLLVTAECDAQTGTGSDTLRMYLSGEGSDPRSTTPAFEMALPLTGGVVNTTSGEFTGDTRVLDLFDQRQVQLSITNAFRGPSSGPALEGEVRLTKIQAIVVAGRSGL